MHSAILRFILIALTIVSTASRAEEQEGEWNEGTDLGAIQNFDCDQLAKTPSAPMSVESCRQMMSAAMGFARASQDKSAARPGDEAMNCAEIEREISTLPGIELSEKQLAENQTASTQYQQRVAEQMAEIKTMGTAATVATTAAHAEDIAVGLATGGVVNSHMAMATQQAALAAGMARSREMAQERQPQEQRFNRAMNETVQAEAGKLQTNPRYARLVQLAVNRDCKGEGLPEVESPMIKEMGGGFGR